MSLEDIATKGRCYEGGWKENAVQMQWDFGKVQTDHNNNILKKYFSYFCLSAQYITLVRGAKLLIIDTFTYYKQGFIKNNGRNGYRYVCSSRDSKKCKAHAHVSTDDFIMKTAGEHNHPPTNYLKTINGLYTKTEV